MRVGGKSTIGASFSYSNTYSADLYVSFFSSVQLCTAGLCTINMSATSDNFRLCALFLPWFARTRDKLLHQN